MRWYIAAPFFNVQELAVVETLEDDIERCGDTFFSPRSLGVVDLSSPRDRRQKFDSNAEELRNATAVVAVMDRHAKPGTELAVINTVSIEHEDGRGPTHLVEFHDVRLPDVGTVWEVGYAYALQKPVVLFTLDAASKVNLMLTEASIGVVRGHDDFRTLLATPYHEWGKVLDAAAHLPHAEEDADA